MVERQFQARANVAVLRLMIRYPISNAISAGNRSCYPARVDPLLNRSPRLLPNRGPDNLARLFESRSACVQAKQFGHLFGFCNRRHPLVDDGEAEPLPEAPDKDRDQKKQL